MRFPNLSSVPSVHPLNRMLELGRPSYLRVA